MSFPQIYQARENFLHDDRKGHHYYTRRTVSGVYSRTLSGGQVGMLAAKIPRTPGGNLTSYYYEVRLPHYWRTKTVCSEVYQRY